MLVLTCSAPGSYGCNSRPRRSRRGDLPASQPSCPPASLNRTVKPRPCGGCVVWRRTVHEVARGAHLRARLLCGAALFILGAGLEANAQQPPAGQEPSTVQPAPKEQQQPPPQQAPVPPAPPATPPTSSQPSRSKRRPGPAPPDRLRRRRHALRQTSARHRPQPQRPPRRFPPSPNSGKAPGDRSKAMSRQTAQPAPRPTRRSSRRRSRSRS
jgi:hypothetical protein